MTNRKSGFLGLAMRQRLLKRWPTMHCIWPESVLEHTSVVALLAYMAAHLARNRGKDVSVERMVGHALVHDQAEVVGSDIPQTLKEYPEFSNAYAKLETKFEKQILDTLPAELKQIMSRAFHVDGYEKDLTKACDIYSAYLKSVLEVGASNRDFQDVLSKMEVVVADLCERFEEIKILHELFNGDLNESVDALLASKPVQAVKRWRDVS